MDQNPPNMRICIERARLGGALRCPDGAYKFEFQFKADDPTFTGHFPGRPLLPGVFQLQMARAAAEWVLGTSLVLREISKAKFQRPILPSETVSLILKLSEEAGTVQARAHLSVDGQPAGESLLLLTRNNR
jgi:3-hydroxyacyl-[acyl-carrier-protein] dehydratase